MTRPMKCRNGYLFSRSQNGELAKQNSFLKENNTQALKQLEDMSVITSTQAESINKSLDNIGAKDVYIMDLQKEMARKDSLNMALVMNLKGAIGNLSDEDINIKVDKGFVFIDISDKLLFKSGSYVITSKSKGSTRQGCQVLKNQPDLQFMVEGHTDNVPYSRSTPARQLGPECKTRNGCCSGSSKRSMDFRPAILPLPAAVNMCRLLSNDTPQGRAINRRTRIVILPQLDQFFKLLETK